MNVYWTPWFEWEEGFVIAATAEGLAFAGSAADLQAHTARWRPGALLVEEAEVLAPYKAQFERYRLGERPLFDFPFDAAGTPFQQVVWRALQAIPYGETASYADIAARIDKPGAARATGGAIGANPILIAIPCHRIIGKSGRLTGFRSGLEMKRRLLALERAPGVAPDRSGYSAKEGDNAHKRGGERDDV